MGPEQTRGDWDLLAGHDAVISASRFQTLDAAVGLGAETGGRPTILVVGGAGSLGVASGKALMDTPGFPNAFKAEAGAGRCVSHVARREGLGLDVYIAMQRKFAPGERTGKFRLGSDALLFDAEGKSRISMKDFAIALIEELERPGHSRQRFTP